MWLVRAYRGDGELAAEQPLDGLKRGDLERRLGFAPMKLGSTPLDSSQLAALADILREPTDAELDHFLDFDIAPSRASSTSPESDAARSRASDIATDPLIRYLKDEDPVDGAPAATLEMLDQDLYG
jgi:hypothetical protein